MSDKEKVTTEQTEPYQQKMKAKNRKMKVRLIGKGKGPKAAPYTTNPSMNRSKSAPPGFGALGEAKEADAATKGLAKMIINADWGDKSATEHYLPLINPDPGELARAIVDEYIEGELVLSGQPWHKSRQIAGAFDARYGDYTISDYLKNMTDDWMKLDRITKADPEGFSIEDFKVINKESYEGAIYVIKQQIQSYLAARNPVKRR